MARLSSNEREKIWSLLGTDRMPFNDAKSVYETSVNELLVKKYRLSYCILLMEQFHLLPNKLRQASIPDVTNYLQNCYFEDMGAETNPDETYFARERAVIEYYDFCENFFIDSLSANDWKIKTFYSLSEYEELSDEEISFCRPTINALWGYEKDRIKGEEAPEYARLNTMGCSPDIVYVDYFEPYSGLLFYQPSILQLAKICKNTPDLKEELLYKEISKYLSAFPFGRYFPDFDECGEFTSDKGFSFSHLFAKVTVYEEEFCGFHQLNPEVVVAYMLASMAAEEFLEKIDGRVKKCA